MSFMKTEYALLYRHSVCGKLSASLIILNSNEINHKDHYLETKSKSNDFFCTHCIKGIEKEEVIYNTPKYCLRTDVYYYLAKESNLYSN